MQYLFLSNYNSNKSAANYSLVESSSDDKHQNINHIFQNIITKMYDWQYIGSASEFNIADEVDVDLFDFDTFFEPHDFVDERQAYNKEDIYMFSSLFYEMDSALLRKVLEYFNAQYIMEDIEEKSDEFKYLSFILKEGSSSRPDVDFSTLSKGKE